MPLLSGEEMAFSPSAVLNIFRHRKNLTCETKTFITNNKIKGFKQRSIFTILKMTNFILFGLLCFCIAVSLGLFYSCYKNAAYIKKINKRISYKLWKSRLQQTIRFIVLSLLLKCSNRFIIIISCRFLFCSSLSNLQLTFATLLPVSLSATSSLSDYKSRLIK